MTVCELIEVLQNLPQQAPVRLLVRKGAESVHDRQNYYVGKVADADDARWQGNYALIESR